MTTWTNIPDTALEPGKPIRSVDGLALRDNAIAIAEGAAGAPKIQNAAVNTGALGAEKFQSGTTERDWVLARTASAAVGAFGTYAMLYNNTATLFNPGVTVAGSSLDYSSAGTTKSITSPPGTWRCMGTVQSTGAGDSSTSLFLRIS